MNKRSVWCFLVILLLVLCLEEIARVKLNTNTKQTFSKDGPPRASPATASPHSPLSSQPDITLFEKNDPRLDSIRYIFFISMGHQGTRGLSRICNSSAQLCNFETRWDAPELEKFSMCLQSRNNAENIRQWSMNLMSNVYLPHLRDQMAASHYSTMMEPGHNLVCGRNYAALCEILGDTIGLVRWSRHPLETAWSFCSEQSGHMPGGHILSKKVAWILVMDEASYLRIPQEEYAAFNCFQAALWAQDELQQQYLDAAQTSCKGRIIADERWQNTTDYSTAVLNLDRILPYALSPSEVKVDNPHVSQSAYLQRLPELQAYHDQYIEVMRYYYPNLPEQLKNY